MPEIYLIGLMHEDLEVPKKLKAELTKRDPTVVTLEWDKRLDKIEWNFIKAVGKLGINERIFNEFGHMLFPLEYVATLEYCQEKSKPLKFIDARSEDELMNVEANRLALYYDIKQMNEHQAEWWMACKLAQNKTRQMIITYGKDLDAKCELDEALKDADVGFRDKVMANRILEIYHRLGPEEKVVHVGGIAHMMKDENGLTLYERLKSFQPKVIPLLEKYTTCCRVRQYLDY